MDETPTTDVFIDLIIDRRDCYKHDAPLGYPCFATDGLDGDYNRGVCDTRAKRAGFNARINPASLSNGKKRNFKK